MSEENGVGGELECREAFERRFKLDSIQCAVNAEGNYHDKPTQWAWQGFRAAWNLRQQVPDGWQLVPKEPTSEWIRQCNDNDGERTWDWEMLETVLSSAPKPEDVK